MDMDNGTYERSYDMKAAAGFLAGVLLGGLAGAVTMLLLAPQSGKRTRAQIQRKSMELRDQASEAVDDALAQVRVKTRQVTTGIHDKAEKLQQYGQEMLDGQRNRVSTALEAGAKAVKV